LRRRFRSVIGFLISAILVSACGSSPAPAPAANTPAAAPAAPAPAAPAAPAAPTLPKINYRGTIGSGGLGGVIYVMAAGFANLANTKVPGMSLTVESTSGSVELAQRVGSPGDLAFATASSDAVFYAHRGGRSYKQKYDQNRAVLGGNAGQAHMYVLKDSPYKTWEDLRGKRIAIVSKTSLNYTFFEPMWLAMGLKLDDYKLEFIQSGQYADALRDGQIDAGFIVAAYPVAAATQIAATKGIRVLGITNEAADKLVKDHPYWHKATIPKGVYNGHETDAITLGNQTILIANKDVPNDVVYMLTKTLIEHPKEVAGFHPAGIEWTNTKGYALRGLGVVPMHPGAEKYYKEIGLIK
jgi:TRAP transporter TAXI family solute receptor